MAASPSSYLRVSLLFNIALVGSIFLMYTGLTNGGMSIDASRYASSSVADPYADGDLDLNTAAKLAATHVSDPASTVTVTQTQMITSIASPPPPPAATGGGRCGICTAGETGRQLCHDWGKNVVERSVAYSGDNTRLRRVLARLRRGEAINVGIIGGSVSFGQGVWADNTMPYSKLNMHVQFFNHLVDRFPVPQGSVMERLGDSQQHGFINGAQPGRGSDYFVMCSQIHVPEVDLVLVELAVNDQPIPERTVSYEYLIRTVMERPNAPAVMSMQAFSLELDTLMNGGDLHLATEMFYNIPTFAPRNGVLSEQLQNLSMISEWFYNFKPSPESLADVDFRHFGPIGHKFSAELMAAYIDLQLCEMDDIEEAAGHTDADKLYPLSPVPRLSLLSQFSREHPESSTPKLTPYCKTVAALNPEHALEPETSNGWETYTWHGEDSKTKSYLVAKGGVGSTIEFAVPASREIQIYYLRSRQYSLGKVNCVLDGNSDTTQTLDGYWDDDRSVGEATTWHDVQPGDHRIECEVLEESSNPDNGHEFRVMSIMSV